MLTRSLRLIRTCITIQACILLSACSILLAKNTASDLIPDGSQLIIRQNLTIPGGKARVYIQYGKVIKENEKDQYLAHCWLQSWKVLEYPQEIKADTFTIKSSSRYEDLVYKTRPLLLASNSKNEYALQVSFGSVTAIDQQTVLHIHSEKQPDIRELVCSYWDDPANDKHLTLQEIRAALGDIIQLKLAD